jgi:hypothetical protein
MAYNFLYFNDLCSNYLELNSSIFQGFYISTVCVHCLSLNEYKLNVILLFIYMIYLRVTIGMAEVQGQSKGKAIAEHSNNVVLQSEIHPLK